MLCLNYYSPANSPKQRIKAPHNLTYSGLSSGLSSGIHNTNSLGNISKMDHVLGHWGKHLQWAVRRSAARMPTEHSSFAYSRFIHTNTSYNPMLLERFNRHLTRQLTLGWCRVLLGKSSPVRKFWEQAQPTSSVEPLSWDRPRGWLWQRSKRLLRAAGLAGKHVWAQQQTCVKWLETPHLRNMAV